MFSKSLKTLLLTDHQRWLLLPPQNAKHENTPRQLREMGSLFDGKYNQHVLAITEAYLEPSRKSKMELFSKNG